MTHWKTPIGDARLNRALRNVQLNIQNAKVIAEMAREADPGVVANSSKILSRIGDEKMIRGIPMTAEGVGGTQYGTNPLAVLMSKQPNED